MEDKLKLKRKEGESFDDYRFRLYKNKNAYGVKNKEIYKLLIKVAPKHYGESTLRCSSMDMLKGYSKKEKELKQNFDKSVMIINDLHLPYERKDVLGLITKHANEIDTLIIAGDIMDCESVSKFPKIERLTLKQELIYTYKFMKKIRKILNNNQKIVMINGNHEERWYRDICNMQQKNMQEFVNPNILDMLVEGFIIYDNNKKIKYDGIKGITYVPHWYANIDNKIIVAHPKDFSQVDGKMCEKASEHFLNKHEEFEVVVFGHTHKYSQMKVSRRQGIYVVENGCLCQPHEYADYGKLSYTPQDYCYTIVKYNNNEKINFNNIKVYHLDEIYNNKENYKVILN